MSQGHMVPEEVLAGTGRYTAKPLLILPASPARPARMTPPHPHPPATEIYAE